MKDKPHKQLSLFDIFGDWNNVGVKSSLVERLKIAWNKPLSELTNRELSALLRQRFAVEYILPLARQRIIEARLDDSNEPDEELEKMVELIDLNISI